VILNQKINILTEYKNSGKKCDVVLVNTVDVYEPIIETCRENTRLFSEINDASLIFIRKLLVSDLMKMDAKEDNTLYS
jgi:hypothetical protein